MSQHMARVAAPAPRRARSAADKDARRAALLDAARRLLADQGFGALTMSAIAHTAGVAKGTLFLYFPTKEALGLALVDELLDDWFDTLDTRLGAVRRPATPARVAAAITQVTTARPLLTQLLVLLGPMLEQNIPASAAEAFKARVLIRTIQLGATVERALPSLDEGDGTRVILLTSALVTGLQQMAHPAPVVATVLADDTYAPLRVDFARELEHTLTTYLVGLETLSRPSTARASRRSR
jgi:AcrR family transcriptional regulator